MAQNSRRLTAKSSLLRSSWWPLAGGWCDVMPTTPDNMRSRPIEPRAISEKKIKRTKIIVSPASCFRKHPSGTNRLRNGTNFSREFICYETRYVFQVVLTAASNCATTLTTITCICNDADYLVVLEEFKFHRKKTEKCYRSDRNVSRGGQFMTRLSTRVKIPFSNGILFFIYF